MRKKSTRMRCRRMMFPANIWIKSSGCPAFSTPVWQETSGSRRVTSDNEPSRSRFAFFSSQQCGRRGRIISGWAARAAGGAGWEEEEGRFDYKPVVVEFVDERRRKEEEEGGEFSRLLL